MIGGQCEKVRSKRNETQIFNHIWSYVNYFVYYARGGQNRIDKRVIFTAVRHNEMLSAIARFPSLFFTVEYERLKIAYDSSRLSEVKSIMVATIDNTVFINGLFSIFISKKNQIQTVFLRLKSASEIICKVGMCFKGENKEEEGKVCSDNAHATCTVRLTLDLDYHTLTLLTIFLFLTISIKLCLNYSTNFVALPRSAVDLRQLKLFLYYVLFLSVI